MRKGSLSLLLSCFLMGAPAAVWADGWADGSAEGFVDLKRGFTQQAPLPSDFVTHTVEAGESWETLGRLYSHGPDELRGLNEGTELQTGNVVRIPPPKAGWPVHTVRPGETLWRIGRGYGIAVPQLQQANRLHGNQLLPGQRLRLPRGEKPAWTEPPPPPSEAVFSSASERKPTEDAVISGAQSAPSTEVATAAAPATSSKTDTPGGSASSSEKALPSHGWVEVRLENGRRAWAPVSSLVIGSWQPQPAEAVVETATRFHGVPYRWGGVDPNGYDCSGFVHEVFRLNGHEIPRMADHQQERFVPVERNRLQLGDLVFFDADGSGISHVGIYLGDGRFVHASSSRGVITSGLEEGYYQRSYHSAGRLPLWAGEAEAGHRSASEPSPR